MARSNRQLTQFAVDRIKKLITQGPIPGPCVAGNTEVLVDGCDCGRPPHIVVRLFGEEITRVYMSPADNRVVVGCQISTGNFYDSKGRPSRTTRERLNGILDLLCTSGIIPEGIRVFIGIDGQCCVGKGDTFKVLNSSNPTAAILSHPSDLLIS